MFLCFDPLVSFEEKLNAKEMEHVTKEADICSYLLQIGETTNEFFSKETARTKLKYFKQCMYFCSAGLGNAMFLEIAEKGLLLSEDILNIHRLMYIYCGEKHTYLKIDNKLDNINSRYENSSFNWEIPYIFMPYLASYVLAANDIKNDGSIKSFFAKLNDFFSKSIEIKNKYSNASDINIANIYSKWTNEYLGQEYFSTLDTLYGRYSKTTDQKATIRNSVRGLTGILLDCTEHPSVIPSFVTMLLIHYKNCLLEKEPDNTSYDNNTTLNDLTLFYPHKESWKEEWEQGFIKYLCNELSETTEELLIFISDYLRNNNKTPKYALSVKDFNDFNKQYSSHLNKLLDMMERLDEVMRNFFKFITEERPDIRQYIKDHKLIFDQKNVERHIKILYKTISKHYEQIQTEFHIFVKKVEKSSSPTPENYTTLIPNDDYFNDLKKSIQLAQKYLTENLKKDMEQLTPVLKYNNPGYIEALKYPIYHYEEEDILKIMRILNKEYFHLSDDNMKKLIKHKGWNFPTTRPLVIKFLLELPLIVQT